MLFVRKLEGRGEVNKEKFFTTKNTKKEIVLCDEFRGFLSRVHRSEF